MDAGRIYAVVDNLAMHRAPDVLLLCLAHPRWEFVFQPKYAAYLNLIEPWWKTLRSLALKGRRFETWAEVTKAIEGGRQVLEQTQAPLRLGAAQTAPGAPQPRNRHDAESCLDLPDAPLGSGL